MKKQQNVTKNTIVKIFFTWLPFVVVSIVWLFSGADVTFGGVVTGIVMSWLAAFMSWQLLQLDEMHRKGVEMKVTVREAQTVICDTCPFKMIARSAPLFDERFKKGGLKMVQGGQPQLPLPAPSPTFTSASEASPPATLPG